MKEEALKLADELDATKVNGNKIGGIVKASAMIRRLVEELDKPHKYDPETFTHYCDNNIRPKQTKPLSDEEIDNLIIDKGHLDCVLDFHPTFDTVSVMRFELRRLARAIEERHGIK